MSRKSSNRSGSRGSSGGSRRNYSQPPAQSRTVTKEAIIIRERPRSPGLFGQFAATAAGVTVGSAVGHAVGEALVGGGRGGQQQQQQAPPPPTEESGPCDFEIKQFLLCAQNNQELSLCQGFNEAILACKKKNGMK